MRCYGGGGGGNVLSMQSVHFHLTAHHLSAQADLNHFYHFSNYGF